MADFVSGENNSDVTETEKVEGAAVATTDVKDASAESSPADKGEKTDLLSAVKAALDPVKEKSPASETQDSKSAEGTAAPFDKDGDKGSETDDLTEEELARLKPKTRKRIENLTAARRERDGRIAELEPKATQFDKVVTFIENAGLSTQEVNDGFEVMRLLKKDLPGAYQRLKPIVDQLEQVLGVQMPADLRTAVEQGQITEAHAKELAQTRSKAALSTQALQNRDQEDESRRQQDAHQEQQGRVRTAIVEWEKSKVGSDPDWKPKQARVMEIVQLETLRREKADPTFAWTPDAAIKFADEALKRVEDEFKRFSPKPKALNPVTDVSSTRSEAKPKTALEAAKQGLARMAG